MKRIEKVESFFNELLLYSGQYALFYIIMNFSKDGIDYFQDSGHTILLGVLILQTSFLVYLGNKPVYRFLGSMIAPVFYTIVEYTYDLQFLFNSAHIFFWIFSLVVGTIQSIQLNNISFRLKMINEYLITILNVFAFLFIYFYFDLSISLKSDLSIQKITEDQYVQRLQLLYLRENIRSFMEDPTHVYVVIGGLLLAISIAHGRVKILQLTEKIRMLFGRYIDKELRDKIISEGKGKAEKIKVCVLFSDLRNFTSISEKYQPEEITAMLNIYFGKWARVSKEYGGIIDKYIGDTVNVASRLESLCKQYNRHLIMSSDSYEVLPEHLKKLFIRSEGSIQLKGKKQTTEIYLLNDA